MSGHNNPTFNLPKISSIVTSVNTTVGVKGSGKSLGLNDGSKNFGIMGADSGHALKSKDTCYNVNIGASYSGGSTSTTKTAIGVVQNTSTSGLTGVLSRSVLSIKFAIKY